MTDIDDVRVSFSGIHALESRAAGYAVAQECLRVQTAAEAQDPTLRTDRLVRLAPAAWPWYVGALGEMEVGAILARLGPEWFVRHAVPIGTATTDIDHLLVGPGGVVVLNTKRHAGASIWVGDRVLRVNRTNKPHLAVARHEAREASRRLQAKVGFPVVVESAIVLVGERSITDAREGVGRVPSVVSSRNLLSWLRSRPTFLSPAKLDLIRLAAEESDTWHVDPHAADTFRVMQRFERLRQEIGDNPDAPERDSSVSPPTSPKAQSSAPTRPTAGRPRKRPDGIHRSRLERVFWAIFLPLIAAPVILAIVGTVIIELLWAAHLP